MSLIPGRSIGSRKNPSHATHEVNIEVSVRFGKEMKINRRREKSVDQRLIRQWIFKNLSLHSHLIVMQTIIPLEDFPDWRRARKVDEVKCQLRNSEF